MEAPEAVVQGSQFAAVDPKLLDDDAARYGRVMVFVVGETIVGSHPASDLLDDDALSNWAIDPDGPA